MNDHPPEVADAPDATDPRLINSTAEDEDTDFDGLPVETDDEIQAGLAESEEDIRAGRVRPAREAILATAGIRFGE